MSRRGSHQKLNQRVQAVKDRYYEGIDDSTELEAPWTSYDHDLDFNDDPSTEYEPETDDDWAGEDPDRLDSDEYEDLQP